MTTAEPRTPRAPRSVLGIDPGLTRCGVGIVAGPASRPTVVHHRCVRTSPETPLEQRLLAVHEELLAVIDEHRPEALAVERVLFTANARTAMATGQAAGVALLAAASRGLTVATYSPNEVKQTVAGDGAADKAAVGRLVAMQLGLSAAPRPADVADALAVALTHLAMDRLAVAVQGTPVARELAEAERVAARTRHGGWERHLASRGLLPEGGR